MEEGYRISAQQTHSPEDPEQQHRHNTIKGTVWSKCLKKNLY